SHHLTKNRRHTQPAYPNDQFHTTITRECAVVTTRSQRRPYCPPSRKGRPRSRWLRSNLPATRPPPKCPPRKSLPMRPPPMAPTKCPPPKSRPMPPPK